MTLDTPLTRKRGRPKGSKNKHLPSLINSASRLRQSGSGRSTSTTRAASSSPRATAHRPLRSASPRSVPASGDSLSPRASLTQVQGPSGSKQDSRRRRSDPVTDVRGRSPRAAAQAAAHAISNSPFTPKFSKSVGVRSQRGGKGNFTRKSSVTSSREISAILSNSRRGERGEIESKSPSISKGRGRPRRSGGAAEESTSGFQKQPKYRGAMKPGGSTGKVGDVTRRSSATQPQRRELPARPGRPARTGSQREGSADSDARRKKEGRRGRAAKGVENPKGSNGALAASTGQRRLRDSNLSSPTGKMQGGREGNGKEPGEDGGQESSGSREGRVQPRRSAKMDVVSEPVKKRRRSQTGEGSGAPISSPYPKRVR
ncbi:unnamed protein product [Choristocarpus tenellus]